MSGITVLDLSRLLPGPYCSMILADHGARVIAVEDGRYATDDFFVHSVYRNKEHVCLNLKTQAGKAIFDHLATRAQVILEGFRPGVAQRLGVDYDSICKSNPQVVYCSLTGYGQSGSASDQAGHDVNYLAASGVLELMGEAGCAPSIPGVQIADLVGGLNAALGIIMALYEKQRTGRGQYVDVAMADSCLALMPMVLYLEEKAHCKLKRGEHLLAHRYACYNVYETADGGYLALGALEHKFWKRLCQHLGLEEYIHLQYDEGRRLEIIQTLRRIFLQKTSQEWEQEFAGIDVCLTPVRNLEQALTAREFRERGMVHNFVGPQGTERELGIPVKLNLTPGTVRSTAPGFGQDTQAVLRELGYDETEIGRLHEQGAVGSKH